MYYTQRKNVRQIAQEARMSFRDIAAILKKEEAAAVNDGNGNGNGIRVVDNQQQQLGNGSSNSNQKSTQAYKLFSEGKRPVEVAIHLGLPERQRGIQKGWNMTRSDEDMGMTRFKAAAAYSRITRNSDSPCPY